MGSGKHRFKPADFSLVRAYEPKRPKMSGSQMKSAWMAYATAFNAKPKKGIGT